MNLLEGIQKMNTVINTKGSEYYDTTYDDNLNLFSLVSRFQNEEKILQLFCNALEEDKELALANLLYLLDIRNGKGERRIFKIIYKELCLYHKKEALIIMPFIKDLGRYDYLLEGLNTLVEEETLQLIKCQLEQDKISNTPSLLAKWLPSHRSHGVNNKLAKKIINYLGISEKEYRLLLKDLRSKLNLVEKNLTTKNYQNIDFSKVPAKAMMKYRESFQRNMEKSFSKYKEEVLNGNSKINTTGLFSYEIIKKILINENQNNDLINLMWSCQKILFQKIQKIY